MDEGSTSPGSISRSWAMITVTGADIILSIFLALSDFASRSLASGVSTKTNRAGQQFMLVGPAAVIS